MGAYETRDANIRGLTLSLVGLFVLLVISLLAMGWMFWYLAAKEEGAVTAAPAQRELPPAPRLQVTPESDLEAVRRAEAALLNSYGWVDRDAGIVRIPIDRAMELLAERGLPARSSSPSPKREGP
ncbi:MAG: hypothetical protein RMK57_02685 [Bryobacterales bacterium]|nr:hypothetical protein [Bryobacteraceae bacterium]MDW8353414.1 hypothetical protein [Bryobacterales bacterium]